MTIANWLRYVHIALHSDVITCVRVNNVEREVVYTGKGCKLLKVPTSNGTFTFISQNPESGTEWAQHAKEGKKVTQVKRGNKYYGVIVNDDVFRYTKKGETPLWMGTLVPILELEQEVV